MARAQMKPADYSLIPTMSCCLSSMKSSNQKKRNWTTRSRMNQIQKTNRSRMRCLNAKMIQIRHQNWKTTILCCGHCVVKSQSRPRCAWGLRQDRRDVHFRRPHALAAGYERSADLL